MFNLQQDDFPVDTHVSMISFFYCIWLCWAIYNTWIFMQIFEIAKTMGWVPSVADKNKSYIHLNQRIPNELKFDLNSLLYTNGKLCRKCSGKKGNKQGKKCDDNSCPLLNYDKESIELWAGKANYFQLFDSQTKWSQYGL